MHNFITLAKDKLDDSIMQEWAIYFYSNLPINANKERTQIETEWFHEFFLAQIIEREDTSLLNKLFRELPVKSFFNLSNLMIKNWNLWSGSTAISAANILAVNAPDKLLYLYKNDLPLLLNSQVDPLKFSSVDLLFSETEDTEFAAFINEFALSIIKLKNSFAVSTLIHSVLKRGNLLSTDTLFILIDKALQIEASENRRQPNFKSLFIGLFGHNEYLEMVFDREQYDSPLKMATIQTFFIDSVFLETLDEWLIKLPSLASALNLLETMSQDNQGCQTLLTLLNHSKEIPEKIQIQLTLAACLQGLSKDSLEISCFDLTTTIDLLAIDLEFSRWNDALIDHLRNFDQATVSEVLISYLEKCVDDFAAIHVVEAMAELKYNAFIPPLINAISENRGDFLHDSAQSALCEIGYAAQTALITQWGDFDTSQHIYGLSVIRNIHGAAANDFAVDHFSELLAFDLEFACELILAAPDRRLVDLLRPELRRKQAIIDRAFYISARLIDVKDTDVDAAKDSAFAERLRIENALTAFETNTFPQSKHLNLQLQCPSCDAVNQYETKGVIISVEENSVPLLADEFPCLSCGENVDFQFTSMARMAITTELLKKTIPDNSQASQNLKVKTVNCRMDGLVIPLDKALSTINKKIATQPKDAIQWFRLGNLLVEMNRPKATLEAYKKAVQYAPNVADAQLSLATTLCNAQQEVEAFKVLQNALKYLKDWAFFADFPGFGHTFADLYNLLRRNLGELDTPLLHPSALTRPKKMGRNDPCSCGSGKKFKKCCGR